VVSGFAVGKKIDIFPCKARIESHVVYVGTYPTIPVRFGEVNEIMIALVDFFELELEVRKSSLVRLLLPCSRCRSRFFSSIAGMRMDSLALYQPLHLHSMEMAVLRPARTTASQKVL